MAGLWRKWWRGQPPVQPGPGFPALAPDEPLFLIGDVHGRADLLADFLALRAGHLPEARAVFLGDMVDRGPHSAWVLRRLSSLPSGEVICLAGNHEAMLLAFLDDPLGPAQSWLAHGGQDTIRSFGLTDVPHNASGFLRLRDAFRNALGPRLEHWLRSLPLWWQSGNILATHAGMDPALPPHHQSPRSLQWGHPEFTRRRRQDGLWVARGHVIVPTAVAEGGRISLDTGAYATGRLSFAVVHPGPEPENRLLLAVTPPRAQP